MKKVLPEEYVNVATIAEVDMTSPEMVNLVAACVPNLKRNALLHPNFFYLACKKAWFLQVTYVAFKMT